MELESFPTDIILSIVYYLTTDEMAYFSLVSTTIRQITMQCKIIDISQIIYRYSTKHFISILKILRFHQFTNWILPSKYVLISDEISTLLIKMIQSKRLTKNISFEPITPNWKRNNCHQITKFIKCIQNFPLQHIKLKMITLSIPSYILEPSQHSLISITSSFKAISKLMRTVTCFPNLEVLRIQHDRNDHFFRYEYSSFIHFMYNPFFPQDIFGTCARDKFKKLKHLTLQTQCITTSFTDIILIVASLRALTAFTIKYCKFSCKPRTKWEISKYYCNKSNTLKQLTVIGMKIGEKRLKLIANYFSKSLQNVIFKHCILPVKLQMWRYFATTCQSVQHISINILPFTLNLSNCMYYPGHGWMNMHASEWRHKCESLATYAPQSVTMNEIIDNSVLNVIVREAFKNRDVDINIIVQSKSNAKPSNKYRFDNIPHSDMSDWKSPKKYEECNLCQSKVGIDFMDDHLDSVCINQIIECILCEMSIRRCDMVTHWDNDCKGYEYRCYECFLNFNNRNNYLEHCRQHTVWNDYAKPMFFIHNVHSQKQREQYFDCNSVQMAWKCLKCERRCFGLESDHNCLHEWKSFSLHGNTVPSLFGQDVVAYWIRNEIEYKYQLYGAIKKEIHLLILAFIVKPHMVASLPKLARTNNW